MTNVSSLQPATRVDFLGPPCVGKSTICKAVLAKDGQQANTAKCDLGWTSIDAARSAAFENAIQDFVPKISGIEKPKKFIRLVVHGLNYFIIRGQRRPFFPARNIENLKRRILREFLEENDSMYVPFVECWFEPEMTQLPPLSVRYEKMNAWMSDWLFTLFLSGNDRILADNSRLTRGFSELLFRNITLGDEEPSSIFEKYCSSSIAPRGIIHLTDEPESIIEKFKNRRLQNKRLHPGHLNKTEQEIFSYTQRRLKVNRGAVDFFRTNGISVLTISCSTDFAKNVESVRCFLRQLDV